MKNSTFLIVITLKWTMLLLGFGILWFMICPILISAASDILPLIGIILIPISIVIFGMLLYKQIKVVINKLKQTNEKV